MDANNTTIEHVSIYLTDYLRNQLSKKDTKFIEEHLQSCSVCQYELTTITNLSNETDKLIPKTSDNFQKAFIYRLFIRTENENIVVKAFSIITIMVLLAFIASSGFSTKNDYASIKDLKVRAQSLFDESFYSGKNDK